MIHAEYVEFDQPSGARVRRLEVFGHAGYANKGLDIVCAGASMLMETLVYLLADCDEAACCAYNEPNGPRVSVKLTGSIYPADLALMDFAKTGLALLAERYPANVHYEDKSQDGQEKMVNLQLFAATTTTAASGGNREELLGPRPAGHEHKALCEVDAGSRNPLGSIDLQRFADGDGGAATAAASAADAAPAVQEPALRPAEERLARRSGVLKRTSREGVDTPHQSAAQTASPQGEALGSEENSDETEKGPVDPEAEGPAAEGDSSKTAKTPEERRAAFRELLSGEYKDLAEEMMQRATNEAARRLEASPEMNDLMQALGEVYGTDAADLKQLAAAIRNGNVKDDAYYERLAMEKGVSTKTARELDKLESQNRQLTEQQQLIQQMERQRAQQAQIAQMQAQWDKEAEALKAQYPFFNKAEVLANPEIEKMMLEQRLSMTNAFRLAYFDRIQREQTAATAQQVEDGVVNRIQQRSARPSENGTRPGGAVQTKIDVSHMSRKEMEEMERRVMRGEVITL